MKFMRTIPLCIMVLFLMACIAACGPSRPDGVLSDSKMEEVLYDYHKAKALGELESPSNKYKATLYYLNVFEKHHTTEQEFDSSLSWYSRNPEAFDRVYQRVIRRIEGEKKVLERSISISGQGSSVTQSGDSVNIWTGMPMFSLIRGRHPAQVPHCPAGARGPYGRSRARGNGREEVRTGPFLLEAPGGR